MIFVFAMLILHRRNLKIIAMKKTIIFLLPLIFFSACGIYKTVTVDHLRLGMTRVEVEDIFGRPEKVLLVSMTEHGRQEISAFKIGNNDIYTLEFMNDLLVRYEFLREDVVFVPPPSHRPYPVQVVPQPVRPAPVDRPPTTKPTPPAPTIDSSKTEQEAQRPERPNRRPASENVRQERTSEKVRPTRTETNRTGRNESNRNNRSSEGSVQNRQKQDL